VGCPRSKAMLLFHRLQPRIVLMTAPCINGEADIPLIPCRELALQLPTCMNANTRFTVDTLAGGVREREGQYLGSSRRHRNVVRHLRIGRHHQRTREALTKLASSGALQAIERMEGTGRGRCRDLNRHGGLLAGCQFGRHGGRWWWFDVGRHLQQLRRCPPHSEESAGNQPGFERREVACFCFNVTSDPGHRFRAR
jgi:hypothetical protein